MDVIEAVGLGKRYGRKKWGLRDCTLSVPAGCVTGLVGPNGSGKTTLLSLAVGMIRPTAGTVRVAGETAGSLAARDLTAFVAQDAPLYQNLPVRDMLRVARNLNVRWDQDRAVSRLDGLGIPLKQRVGALSGGQKAQLALTIALARRPDLLVLDEPLAALDPLARADFTQSVREAVAEDQISAVFSTHVVAELEQVADYLIVLGQGEVLLSGTTAGLTAAHGGQSPEKVILSALRENSRSHPQHRHAGRAPLAPVVVVPAGQPLVAVPAHRGRLAARRVTPPHRRDGAADPPPPRVTPARDPGCGLPHRLTITS